MAQEIPIVEKRIRKKKCCSLWLDITEWNSFQSNTARIYGKKKSASDRLNEFICNENLKDTGKSPELSVEDALADIKQRLQNSLATSAKLGKLWCPSNEPRCSTIQRYFLDLSVSCGALDRNSKVAVDLEAAIAFFAANPQRITKLDDVTKYPDNINANQWEIYIEYVEEKIKQVALKRKLVELRKRYHAIHLSDIDIEPSVIADPEPEEGSAKVEEQSENNVESSVEEPE